MECRDMTPAWFSGHWREWHRGHGCDRDPELPKEYADQGKCAHTLAVNGRCTRCGSYWMPRKEKP